MAQTSEFVTRSDLRAELETLEQRLDAKLTEFENRLDQRFEGRMDALEQRVTDRIAEAIRDAETRILQAFYGYAETTNNRFKQIDMNYAGMLTRVTTLESRMLECERRLNIPPSA